MIRHPSNHGGLTVGGVSVGLGVIAVLAALVHPRIEGARYEARVAETLDMVAVLEGWATGQYRSQGRWPTGSAPADILSVELARGDDGSYRHVDGWYTVRWRDHVIRVPGDTLPGGLTGGIRSVGSITLDTEDPGLTGALIARFGRRRSILTGAGWTLFMAPEGGGLSIGGGTPFIGASGVLAPPIP